MGLELSQRDLEKMLRLLPRLYAANDLKGVLQGIFDVTGELIATDSRNFNDLQWLKSASAESGRDLRIDPEALYEVDMRQSRLAMFVAAAPVRTDLNLEEVCSGFENNVARHPAIIACKKKRGFHTYRLSDLVTDRQFLDTPLYKEFYRHFPVKKLIVTYMAYAPNREVVTALTREGGRDFSERDCNLVRALNPHIRQAWINAQALESTRLQLEQSRALLSEARVACVFLSDEGRALWFSAEAAELLAEFFPGARFKGGELPPPLRAWLNRHPLRPARSLETLPSALFVANTPTARLEARLNSDANGQLAILFKRQATVLSAEGFLYPGLTRRESEVLFWIAQGRTNAAIATLLSASPRTINKHVQNIFLKLGVANRAEAIVAARSEPQNSRRRFQT